MGRLPQLRSLKDKPQQTQMVSRLDARSLAQRWKWLLAGVALVALLLRVWSIDFGLPYLFHPDEPVYVGIVQRIFKTGDLNPHFFNYPSLFFYLNTFSYIPYYLIGHWLGVFPSPADIPAPVFVELGAGWAPMRSTFLLGRMLTATFGLGTVWLTFLVGRQLTRRTLVGLLAALMVSISPTNVALSRYIAPDTFVTFFALLTFWASVHVFQQGKTRQYVVGGIACGLVASTKYNGALIVLCLVAAHFLRCGRSGFKDLRLYLTLILSAVTFFATTPFAVLDYPKFLNDFRFEAWHYSTGHHGMEGDTAYWYLSYLWQIEGPVAALATLEMLRGILARSKATLLLAIFPLSYFSFISYFVVRNERTLLPLTPFLFLSAASLLTSGWGWAARQRARQPLPIVAIGAFTLFLLALPLQVTAQGAVRLGTEDSRTTARVWIDENLPHGSHIALEAYGPYVDPRNFSVEGVGRTVDQPLDWYVTRGFDYIIFGQGMFSRYYADPDRYAKQIAQYEEMFRALEPVKVFTDGGYEIRIYRVTRR